METGYFVEHCQNVCFPTKMVHLTKKVSKRVLVFFVYNSIQYFTFPIIKHKAYNTCNVMCTS